MILTKIFLLLNFLLVQPSSYISFDFRLFDKHGKVVKADEFCTKYKFIRSYQSRELNFCEPQSSLLYDLPTHNFRLSTGTVYNDIEVSFIRKSDTMSVRIINSGYGARVTIDSLVFRPGRYAIRCSSRIVDGKTLPNLPVLKLKQLNFEIAVADYYNFWLDEYTKTMDEIIKQKLSGEFAVITQFLKLQSIYHIPKDDLSCKTAKQLGFK